MDHFRARSSAPTEPSLILLSPRSIPEKSSPTKNPKVQKPQNPKTQKFKNPNNPKKKIKKSIPPLQSSARRRCSRRPRTSRRAQSPPSGLSQGQARSQVSG
eukprot:126549-Prymnesium_polylepis.1